MSISIGFFNLGTNFNYTGTDPNFGPIWTAKSLDAAYITVSAGGTQQGSQGDAGLRSLDWYFYQIKKNGVSMEEQFGKLLFITGKASDRSTLLNAGWTLLSGSSYPASIGGYISDVVTSGDRQLISFNFPMELGDNEYFFTMSGETTHDSGVAGDSAVFGPVPDNTPPLLTLRNKTGQFSSPPITLEVDLFDEISGADKVTGTIDGTAIAEITTFPSNITINTAGSHEVVLYGHDVSGNITAPLTYRFKAEPWTGDSLATAKVLTVTSSGGPSANAAGYVTLYDGSLNLKSNTIADILLEPDLYAFENISQGTIFDYPVPSRAPGVGLNISKIEVFNTRIVVSFLKSAGSNDFENISINVKDSTNTVQDSKTYNREQAAALASWTLLTPPTDNNINKVTLNVTGIEGETYTVDLFGTTIYKPSNSSGGTYVSDDEVYTFTPVGPKWNIPDVVNSTDVAYDISYLGGNFSNNIPINSETVASGGNFTYVNFLNNNASLKNLHIFMGMANSSAALTIDESCNISAPVLEQYDIISPAPDANNNYLFFNPIVIELDATTLTNSPNFLNNQFYKISFDNSSNTFVGFLRDYATQISFTPEEVDNVATLKFFTACGNSITRTMNVIYNDILSSSNPSAPISGTTIGAGATPVNQNTITGSTPFYHSLIITR